jgi:hypothetical protein
MESGEDHEKRLSSDHPGGMRKHAINQLAIGSVILLWGILLSLKQVGIVEKTMSTWPFALTAFGMLLVIGGIYRLSRWHTDAG